MAINGLHVAAEKYSAPDWPKEFVITGARTDATGNARRAILAQWPGEQAAKAHLATVPKMMTWGYIELYAALEEFVFAIFRTYHEHHQDLLLRGDDFRELRKLKRETQTDPTRQTEWNAAWKARLDSWQRKKLYDSLHRVFTSFCETSGIKAPKSYSRTSVQTWAETIEGIALVRHLLVHGEEVVTQELEAFCMKPHSLSFGFQKGQPLRLELHHLWAIECFTDQLLNALNLSLVEHEDAGK